MASREASVSSTVSKAWWPSGRSTELDGQAGGIGGGAEFVDALVQAGVVLPGPDQQEGRQAEAALEVARRPVAQGGAAEGDRDPGHGGSSQRNPGREGGHGQPVGVDAELGSPVVDGGQGGRDLGHDGLEAGLGDGAVLGDHPGQALGGEQPAPAGVLAPGPDPAEHGRVRLAVDQQDRRHRRPRRRAPGRYRSMVSSRPSALA